MINDEYRILLDKHLKLQDEHIDLLLRYKALQEECIQQLRDLRQIKNELHNLKNNLDNIKKGDKPKSDFNIKRNIITQ